MSAHPFPASFGFASPSEARAEAIQRGWTLDRNGDAREEGFGRRLLLRSGDRFFWY